MGIAVKSLQELYIYEKRHAKAFVYGFRQGWSRLTLQTVVHRWFFLWAKIWTENLEWRFKLSILNMAWYQPLRNDYGGT